MNFRIFLAVPLLLSSCYTKFIPNTYIKDTEENRAIYSVMESYKLAMEAMSPDAVLALASPDFFGAAGTADPKDDYGCDKLKQKLADDFKAVKALRLDLIVKSVEVEGGKAFATYHFFLRYQVSLPTGEEWKSKEDDQKMSFKLEGGEWKILSGL